MTDTFLQHQITNSVARLARRSAVRVREAGGRQGRLCGHRKANMPLTGWMNLVWGL